MLITVQIQSIPLLYWNTLRVGDDPEYWACIIVACLQGTSILPSPQAQRNKNCQKGCYGSGGLCIAPYSNPDERPIHTILPDFTSGSFSGTFSLTIRKSSFSLYTFPYNNEDPGHFFNNQNRSICLAQVNSTSGGP